MNYAHDSEHVISQGRLRDGASRVDYYTTMPAPTQWVAVGVVIHDDMTENRRWHRRMLVGTGPDEESAIRDLSLRFDEVLRERREYEQARRKADSRTPRSGVLVDEVARTSRTGLLDGPLEHDQPEQR